MADICTVEWREIGRTFLGGGGVHLVDWDEGWNGMEWN